MESEDQLNSNPFDTIQKAASQIIAVTEAFNKSMQCLIQPLIEQKARLSVISKLISESIDAAPSSMGTIASVGWYPNYFMTLGETHEYAHLIINGNVKKVNHDFSKFINSKYKTIWKELINRYPKRSKILNSAFRAFEKGEYNICVPVFLIQSDGITSDITHGNSKIFIGRDRKNIENLIKELDEKSIDRLLLSPLLSDSLIYAGKKYKGSFKGSFNRHEIIHGTSLYYGTKINALKSIAWLNYVGVILADGIIRKQSKPKGT